MPTPDNALFFLAFIEAMANVYKMEDDRRDTVLGIFEKHKMYIKQTLIGKFGTEGDLSSGKFKILIFKFKNEVGAMGAEPFFKPSSTTLRQRGHLPVNIVTLFYHA